MPFEGPATPRSTKLERCLDLIDKLRDETTWPEGFPWDFSDCNRCAIGLAMCLYDGRAFSSRIAYKPYDFGDLVNDVLGIDGDVAYDLFGAPKTRRGRLVPREAITPAHVADALERYLATGETYYAV